MRAYTRSKGTACRAKEGLRDGHHRAPGLHGEGVLEDFSKILATRAPLKVMVFGYVPKGPRSAVNASHPALIELMKGLISRSDDDAVYILCGVSWRSERRPPIEVLLGPRNSAKGDVRGA